jgi:integrase
MPSVYVFRRKVGGKLAKVYSAQIRFGEPHKANFLRSTGKTNERDALAEARRIARELEEKTLPRRNAEVMTLDEMCGQWWDEHGRGLRSSRVVKWQIAKVLHFICPAREVRDLSNKDIHGFVQDAKAAGDGAVTINRCLETLRAMMNYAAMRWEEPVKVIAWKTFRQKEARVREVYLSPDEARRLMTLLPQHIALAFAFTLYTGMRLNEMETLTWGRIDIDRGLAVVDTKGGGTRPVWLSNKALAVLKTVAGTMLAAGVFDLTNRRSHWEVARKAIGREDVHWHDLRAMTATWARQHSNQKDLSLIGKALGHSGTQVTERYARVVDREIVEMLDQLPDIMPQRADATPGTDLAIIAAINPENQLGLPDENH